MELRHLQYFVAVAERLSFSKAAQQLSITVPPLCRQIRQMEEYLGARLFARNRRQVALTDAGRLLLPEAKEVLARTARISLFIQQAEREQSGSLKVGVALGVGERVGAVLMEHGKRFPEGEIRCEDMFTSSQIEKLLAGEIDIGFLRPPLGGPILESEFLFDEGLAVHISRSHPLAGKKSLRIRDLDGETLLVHEKTPSSGLYDKIFELYRNARVTPHVAYQCSNDFPIGDVQTATLARSKGVFILPDEATCNPPSGSEVVAIPLDDPGARIEVHVAWRKDVKSSAVLDFLETTRKVFPRAGRRQRPCRPPQALLQAPRSHP